MKYINNSNYILIAGEITLNPNDVTNDLSEDAVKSNPDLLNYINKGYLKKFTGEKRKLEPKVDPRRETEKKTQESKVAKENDVLFVVNDTPFKDLGSPVTNSTDEIFPDVTDVSNKVDKMEELLNMESDDNDPDTNLADFEERSVEIDEAKDFMESEYSTIISNAKKSGANIITTKSIVNEIEKATDVIKEEVSKASDEGEVNIKASQDQDKAMYDFLKKPFFTKKKEISTNTDVDFLKRVREITSSDNLKKIVEHRLRELDNSK